MSWTSSADLSSIQSSCTSGGHPASTVAARDEAKKASVAIETARAVAEAERQKQIALIEATKEAGCQATAIRLAALAEKDAASDRAVARRECRRADCRKAFPCPCEGLSIKAQA